MAKSKAQKIAEKVIRENGGRKVKGKKRTFTFVKKDQKK